MRNLNNQRNISRAIGEVFLIVLSILFALFINNLNDQRKFRKVVDRNFIRVAKELEINISDSQYAIKALHKKDSLLYMAVYDSIKYSDYKTNYNLLKILNGSVYPILDDQACQNLISLNNSENTYKNDLILDVQIFSTVKLFVKEDKIRMKDFVSDIGYPYYSKILSNYVGVYEYSNEERINDLYNTVTSPEYRTLVYNYAHLNFLYVNTYLGFYKLAIETRNKICREYNLENTAIVDTKDHVEKIIGFYTNENSDTINVFSRNDSVFIIDKELYPLLYISDNLYFTDTGKGDDHFASFYKEGDKRIASIHLKSDKEIYTKIIDP